MKEISEFLSNLGNIKLVHETDLFDLKSRRTAIESQIELLGKFKGQFSEVLLDATVQIGDQMELIEKTIAKADTTTDQVYAEMQEIFKKTLDDLQSYAKVRLVTREVEVKTAYAGTGENFLHPYIPDF